MKNFNLRLLAIMVLYLLLPLISGMPSTKNRRRQHKEDEDDMIQKQNIEFIKKELLKGLGLKERPKVDNKPIPIHLLNKLRNKTNLNQDEWGERTFIINALPYKGLKKDSNYVKFSYKSELTGTEINSIELWLHQNPENSKSSHVVTLTLIKDGVADKVLLRSRIRSNSRGWATVSIKNIQDWVQKSESETSSLSIDVVVKVDCAGCSIKTKGKHSPYLRFQEAGKVNTRKRRSYRQCHQNQKTCCLDDYWIDLKKIGWDDWILAPARYNARKCRGTCEGNNGKTSGHSALLKLIEKKKVCCIERRHEPLEILYRRHDTVNRKLIQGLVVTECECA